MRHTRKTNSTIQHVYFLLNINLLKNKTNIFFNFIIFIFLFYTNKHTQNVNSWYFFFIRTKKYQKITKHNFKPFTFINKILIWLDQIPTNFCYFFHFFLINFFNLSLTICFSHSVDEKYYFFLSFLKILSFNNLLKVRKKRNFYYNRKKNTHTYT